MSKLLLMNNVARVEDDLNYFCMYSENFDKVPEKYRWNRIYPYNGNEIKEMYNIPPNIIKLTSYNNSSYYENYYYPSEENLEKYKGSYKGSDDESYFGLSGNKYPSLEKRLRIENLKYNDKIYFKIIAYKNSKYNYSEQGMLYYSLRDEDGNSKGSNDIDDIGGYYTGKEIIIDLENDYTNLDKNKKYNFYFFFRTYTGFATASYFKVAEVWVNYDNYLSSIQ